MAEPRLSEVGWLDEDERRRILVDWNQTERPLPQVAGVEELVTAKARLDPQATAVMFGDAVLAYGELEARANRLAHYLQAQGVRPDVVVGLCVERGVEWAVGLLAVLKAGGAYLPLDPEYPAERLEFMLADSRASLVLGQAGALDMLAVPRGARLVVLDDPCTAIELEAQPVDPPRGTCHPDQLAYVIYTSGSTGRPKGVLVSRRSLLNLVVSQCRDFGVGVDDVALQFASFSFDVATCELLVPLSVGAVVVIADQQARLSPAVLEALLESCSVSLAQIPPAVAGSLALDKLADLRVMVTGGEAFPAESALRWARGRRLLNAYGPTETTVCASLGVCPADAGSPDPGPPPIGRPIANTRCYVVDRSMGLVPVGVAGELFIGGLGLARGYGGRPGLSAERFVADPFGSPGGRLYRTGDRASWRADGELEWVGRIDEQVKLRGHRIEPGEIETTLAAHPAVSAAAVVAHENKLVAYVSFVPPKGHERNVGDELREWLGTTLPDYMVPSLFVELDELPLSPTGKVDRARLPAPGTEHRGLGAADYVAPRNPTQELLAGVWAEVLGVERVGVHDSFFDLGGHSLLVTQVVSRLRAMFDVELALSDMFDHPSLSGLAALVDGGGSGPGAEPGNHVAPPITPVDRDEREAPIPLSFAQQRLWFLDQLEPGGSDYNVPAALLLKGPLEVNALGAALGTLVERHEVLRTRLVAGDGAPHQEIDAPGRFELGVVDLSAEPDAMAQAEMLVAEDAGSPFDLATGPLFRVRLLRVAPEDHVLSLVLHHVVADEWSASLLRRELSALYDAYSQGEDARLPPLPVQYADFAIWQRDWLQGEILDSHLAYWRERLADAPVLELPTDRQRPPLRSSAGAVAQFELPADITSGLRALSRQAGATMFMTLLAGFNALLGHYAGQNDVVVGSPIANRNRSETEGIVGFFVNNLVLRTDLSGDPSFTELVARVRHVALGAYAHQDLPFEQLVEDLQPDRDRSRTPLFQVLFDYAPGGAAELGLAGLEASGLGEMAVSSLGTPGTNALFDLSIALGDEAGGGLGGSFEYSTELFDRSTMERLVAQLVNLLARMAADPGCRLSELSLLGPAERHQLVVERNDTASPLPVVAGVDELVAARTACQPAATAATFGEDSLTYAELDSRANLLAHRLQGVGVGPETVVGLSVPRGLDLLVAVLGVWKAGGAYLPLDPDQPPERLRYMLADSGAPVLLAQRGTTDELAAHVDAVDGQVVWLDDPPIGSVSREPPKLTADADRLAYVIYTSGSTGRPKGVQVTQASLMNFLLSMAQRPGLSGADVLLAVTTLGFDIANLELFLPLVVGARVVIADAETARSPDLLAAAIERSGVSVMQATPATWRMLLAGGWTGVGNGTADSGGHKLRVFCGGETLSPDLAVELGGRSTEVWNLYGPTETTVWSSSQPLPPGALPSLGHPIANTQLYVVDCYMAPVPFGVAGELLIGGEGVARGYRGQPALTAERFLADPFAADGTRLYRSGDRARWRVGGELEDGELDYLGRIDHQLKVRGFRVEPGEVEAALLEHSGIGSAAVMAHDAALVAYVVPADPAGVGAPAPDELRAFVANRLPAFMVPALFVELASLPLSANGKLDRAALPPPPVARPGLSIQFQGPRTPTEEVLAGLYAEVLSLESVGIDDGFFDLGGHSLIATQLISRLRRVFEVELALAELFDQPTVAGLAAVIDATGCGELAPPVTARPRDGLVPLSFAQQRLWFLDQLEPGSTDYNMPLALRFQGPLDSDALGAAFAAVIERHEVLRTRLVASGGVAQQIVDPAIGFQLEMVDLSPESEALARAEALVADDARIPFDLGSAPLLRGRLIRIAADDHVLSLVMHHIVADEWSTSLLHRELSLLYEAFAKGEASPLAPLAVQYADFALWQREWLQDEKLEGQLAYWREQLDGAPLLELPIDRRRPPVRSSAGALVELRIPPDTAASLRALSRRAGATMFMTLLAAFDVLLARYAGQDDIVVGTPIANRNQAETEDLIGMFVNTLVLRADLSGDPSFAEVLARVRHQALAAYANQDLPFEQLLEALQPERDRSRTPLFQVLFNYDQRDAGELGLSGVEAGLFAAGEPVALTDLRLLLGDDPAGGLGGVIEYSTELFDRPTIERLAGHLSVLLEALAADPGRRLSELPLMSRGERHEVLLGWNDTARALPAASGVPELVTEQARRDPDATAVSFGGQSLSYRELEAQANRLAHYLRAQGVVAEVVVGLCMDRSLEMVVAMLGVLKAGGAYLPLDPDYPADRLGFMLADSRASVLLGRSDELDLLPAQRGRAVYLDDPATRTAIAALPPTALAGVPYRPDQLAYVMYTSGSTGRPKGIGVCHRDIVSLVALGDYVPFAPDDVVAQASTTSFDAATFEVWGALANGATLAGIDKDVLLSPTALCDELARLGVTVLFLTPALFNRVAAHRPEGLAGLRHLVLGGEALDPVSVGRVQQRDRPGRLVNGYGPTETTTFAVCHEIEVGSAETIPIGRPLANMRARILDRWMQPVPIGVPGELYLGGVGVARGYVGRGGLTAERFVADPFLDGARLYRTGDRVCWRAGGVIDFQGRLDEQVKVRGYRIEPAEIESALVAHGSLRSAAVVAHDDGGDRRLVAYLVPSDMTRGVPSTSELRAFLGDTLPGYMVPGLFVELTDLPLNPNGKIDRLRLPTPDTARPELAAGFSPPRTPTEEALVAVWCEVLGLEQVGVHDDFFDLGGHSLLATQVASRLRAGFGIDLALSGLFDNPTVAALAELVEAQIVEEVEQLSEQEAQELLEHEAETGEMQGDSGVV